MSQEARKKLEFVTSREFKNYSDMYKVVDFLNKTLKEHRLIFGLSKTEDGNMLISIYKT